MRFYSKTLIIFLFLFFGFLYTEFISGFDVIKPAKFNNAANDSLSALLNDAKLLSDSNFSQKDSLLKNYLILSKDGDPKIISQIYYDLGLLNFRNNNFIEAKNYYNQANKIYNQLKDKKGNRLIFEELGYCFQRLGESDSASHYFSLDVELSGKLKNDSTLANAFTNLGHVEWRKGEFNSALNYFKKALGIREKLDLKYNVASSLNSIGSVFWKRGKYGESLEYFLKSLKIREELKDTTGMVISINNIGTIYQKLKYLDKAEEFFDKALSYSKSSNYNFGVSYSLYNLGLLNQVKGNYEKAIQLLKESLLISERISELNLSLMTMIYIGENCESLMNFKDAYNHYHDASKGTLRYSDNYTYALAQNRIANIFYKQNKPFDEIYKHLSRSKNISESENLNELKKDTYEILYKLYERELNFRESLNYYEMYTAIKDSILNEKLINNITDMIVRVEIEKTEAENNLLKKEKELQENELIYQKSLRNSFIIAALLSVIFLVILIFYIRNKIKYSRQVTEQKEALDLLNKELNKNNYMLENAVKTKDKLFSIIAHDLRGPFSPLLSNVEFVLDEWNNLTDAEIIDSLKDISNATSNLYQLLEDLLSWSLLQRATISIEKTLLNAEDVVEQVINLYQKAALNKEITLLNSVEPNITILADLSLINTLLRNLISNAIKFTNKNGLIEIKAETKEEKTILIVEDTGVGISRDTLDEFKDSSSVKSSVGTGGERGTGLGLTLCREIMESHSGDIKIESNIGEGTRFICVFPK